MTSLTMTPCQSAESLATITYPYNDVTVVKAKGERTRRMQMQQQKCPFFTPRPVIMAVLV